MNQRWRKLEFTGSTLEKLAENHRPIPARKKRKLKKYLSSDRTRNQETPSTSTPQNSCKDTVFYNATANLRWKWKNELSFQRNVIRCSHLFEVPLKICQHFIETTVLYLRLFSSKVESSSLVLTTKFLLSQKIITSNHNKYETGGWWSCECWVLRSVKVRAF